MKKRAKKKFIYVFSKTAAQKIPNVYRMNQGNSRYFRKRGRTAMDLVPRDFTFYE